MLGNAFTKTATYSVDPARHPDQKAEWLRRAQTERLCGVPAQPDFSYTYTFVAGAGVNDLYTGTVSCQLVARPQIDAVTPDTDLVFLTIGGNDIGFSTIVVDCLTLRDPSSCKQALDAASAKAPEMVQRTKDALRAVEQARAATRRSTCSATRSSSTPRATASPRSRRSTTPAGPQRPPAAR